MLPPCAQPAKMHRVYKLTKSPRAMAKTLANATAGTYYRSDLKKAALARLSMLTSFQKRKAADVKRRPKSRKLDKY